jgi:hypothetical protein
MERPGVVVDVVIHADWSTTPGKRWMVRADRQADSRYAVDAPKPVGTVSALLEPAGVTTLIGVDFPIGVPVHYARRAGIVDFPRWLGSLSDEQLARFWTPAASWDEITVERPFYPARSGSAKQHHLIAAHFARTMDDLQRTCELKPPLSRKACSLFWTLGGNQVGRAALAGWRDLVRPGLQAAPPIALWPFDGALANLLAAGGTVVAETYPAEFYAHLSLPRFAKTQRDGRRACVPALGRAVSELGVDLNADAAAALSRGFASDDDFDAFVGVLGMLNVLAGHRPAEPPEEVSAARTVEGWILGAGDRARHGG